LTDLIAWHLDWTVMGKIYGKITGPWPIRWKIRNQVLKGLDTAVSTAVGPAWGIMAKTVEELRPKIEPKIKENIEPIAKAQKELEDKIKDACMSVIEPILKEHVAPHLSKIMEIVKSPMTDGFAECIKIFDERVGKWQPKGPSKEEVKESFRFLDEVPRWYWWEMRSALRPLDALYEPLWALNTIFPEIWPWTSIWKAHDYIVDRMDSAMYTLETKVSERLEAGETYSPELVGSVKEKLMEDFKEDCKTATFQWYLDIMKDIIMPPLNKLVSPPVGAVLDPINGAIPDAMKDFLDVQKMFDDILESIVDDSCKIIING